MRSFLPFLLILFLLGSPSVGFAETAPNPELEAILQKIESRHSRWIAIRAEVLFLFAKAGGPDAMCAGELLYQRLDERMFLVCTDTQKKLAFVFRTFDRQFDLYLPSQNTVYHGSIFDMEDSPAIESHLKARDLYRALKPMAVDPRHTRIERTNSLVTNLDVYSSSGAEETLARRLYLTPSGDVRGEIYYGPNGRSVTEIQRYDFKEFRGSSGIYDSIIFPKKVTIVSPESQKGSALFFTKVKALDTIDPLDFILRVPPGTKEVFLEEKEPPRKPLKAASPASAPPVKKVPVYYAKPREVAEKKITAPPPEKKKETPESPAPVILASVREEKADAPAIPPAKTPAELPSPTAQPPALDNQTTLDPSVDPSVEMGKR